jgi:hypothetical protein
MDETLMKRGELPTYKDHTTVVNQYAKKQGGHLVSKKTHFCLVRKPNLGASSEEGWLGPSMVNRLAKDQ